MNRYVSFLVLFSTLTACRQANEELRERIINSDSIAINYFTGDGSMDSVISVKIIRDKQSIGQLASIISATTISANYKCGVDGSLHFFKINRVVQDVDFRMSNADCMQFSFLQQGQLKAAKLPGEAKELLEKLRK